MKIQTLCVVVLLFGAPLYSGLYAGETLLGSASADTDAGAATLDSAAPATGAQNKTAASDQTASATPAGSVARAVFTQGINDREPIDAVSTVSNDANQIYYFTELKDMAGQTVTHRWEYNGKVMAEVPFNVGSDRWRTYSSKNLDPLWLGEWKVSVVDAAGSTINVNTFTYTQSMAKPEAESTPAPEKTQ